MVAAYAFLVAQAARSQPGIRGKNDPTVRPRRDWQVNQRLPKLVRRHRLSTSGNAATHNLDAVCPNENFRVQPVLRVSYVFGLRPVGRRNLRVQALEFFSRRSLCRANVAERDEKENR